MIVSLMSFSDATTFCFMFSSVPLPVTLSEETHQLGVECYFTHTDVIVCFLGKALPYSAWFQVMFGDLYRKCPGACVARMGWGSCYG